MRGNHQQAGLRGAQHQAPLPAQEGTTNPGRHKKNQNNKVRKENASSCTHPGSTDTGAGFGVLGLPFSRWQNVPGKPRGAASPRRPASSSAGRRGNPPRSRAGCWRLPAAASAAPRRRRRQSWGRKRGEERCEGDGNPQELQPHTPLPPPKSSGHSQARGCLHGGLVPLDAVHLAVHHVLELVRPAAGWGELRAAPKPQILLHVSPRGTPSPPSAPQPRYLEGRSSVGLYSPSSSVPSSYRVLAITRRNLSPVGTGLEAGTVVSALCPDPRGRGGRTACVPHPSPHPRGTQRG